MRILVCTLQCKPERVSYYALVPFHEAPVAGQPTGPKQKPASAGLHCIPLYWGQKKTFGSKKTCKYELLAVL